MVKDRRVAGNGMLRHAKNKFSNSCGAASAINRSPADFASVTERSAAIWRFFAGAGVNPHE